MSELKIDRLDLFPVPIIGAHYDHAESLAQTLIPEFKKIEQEDKNPAPYSANGYTNYNPGTQVIERIECNDLREWIGQVAMEGNKILGIEADLTFVGSWFSINRKHTYHEMHNHIPATWSGVYYLQAEPDNGNLALQAEHGSLDYTKDIKPETNLLVVFPMNTPHFTRRNTLETERIAIAGNIIPIMKQKEVSNDDNVNSRT